MTAQAMTQSAATATEQEAWGKYLSAARMGGTDAQREWAYARWRDADEKLAAIERALAPRTRRLSPS